MVNKALEKSFFFLFNLLEVNDNLGECHFGCVEVARPMLEFKRLLSRGIVNNPYFIQDDLSSE